MESSTSENSMITSRGFRDGLGHLSTHINYSSLWSLPGGFRDPWRPTCSALSLSPCKKKEEWQLARKEDGSESVAPLDSHPWGTSKSVDACERLGWFLKPAACQRNKDLSSNLAQRKPIPWLTVILILASSISAVSEASTVVLFMWVQPMRRGWPWRLPWIEQSLHIPTTHCYNRVPSWASYNQWWWRRRWRRSGSSNPKPEKGL